MNCVKVTTDPSGTGGRATGDAAAMPTMTSAVAVLATPTLYHLPTLILVSVVAFYVAVVRRRLTALLGGQ